MNRVVVVCLALGAFAAQAADTKVYQTDKYGNVQYHKPSLVVRPDGRVQAVDPYGNVQSHQPGFQVKVTPAPRQVGSSGSLAKKPTVPNGTVYQTDAYGNRKQPAYVIQNGKVYEADRYGNRKQQAFVIQGDTVYQTDAYGNRQQPVYKVQPPPLKK
ncbi:MAG: hypothetical protein NT025_00065 [bacterium]|nr:hypothetical protein [bacterium]